MLNINIELYKDHAGKKHIYVTPKESGITTSYPFNNSNDIGKSVALYLDDYFPKFVDDPNYNAANEEDE